VLGPVQINVSSSSSQFLARFGADGYLTTPWTTAAGDAANLGTSPFFELQFQQDVTVTEVQLFGNRGFGDNINIRAGIFQLFGADGTVLFDSGNMQFSPPTRDFVLTLPGLAGVRRVRLTSTADFGSSVGLSELKVIGSATVATREANIAPSRSCFQVTMKTGRDASRSWSLWRMAPAISCASRSERTISHESLAGDCRIGKNMAGCGSSVRLMYLPFSATPTTSMRTPSLSLK